MPDTARVVSICSIAFVAVAVGTAPAAAAKPVEQLTAFAVDMSNMARGARTGTVDITIARWSTDEERNLLTAALQEGVSDGLLRALQKEKEVGRIRSTGSIGYPLRFAREIPLSTGGRRIVLGTDRPVSFLERLNPTATSDYPFMVIDIRLNAKGEGEGKLMPLAKVTMNEDHVVEIENYASEPVRLTSVRRLK